MHITLLHAGLVVELASNQLPPSLVELAVGVRGTVCGVLTSGIEVGERELLDSYTW